MVTIIVAVSSNNGIGFKNKIPWNIKSDIEFFKNTTTKTFDPNKKNAVIMGRKTWESIPDSFLPLKNRYNIVVTKSICISKTDFITSTLDHAILHAKSLKKIETIFLIGGYSIYKEGLKFANSIILTDINKKYKCDVFFPKIPPIFTIKYYSPNKDGEINMRHIHYVKNIEYEHPEYQYLRALNNIRINGDTRVDRTGVGTKSILGLQMRFDISKYFPLLTTKRVFIKSIIHELLWFLRGQTNVKLLQENGVHIWDGNTTKEFMAKQGQYREDGDGGPIYGFNFRHYGAKYNDCYTDYSGKGIDQVKYVLNLIKTNPTSRRMIINLWNPDVLDQMALPPCLMTYQFYVSNGKLSCSLYQRSGDMGLGVPFNIASATLMTYIFAKLTDLKPGELVHSIGDAHIYLNHLNGLKKQIDRTPTNLPIMKINENKEYKCIEDFEYEDFEVIGYKPHPSIKMAMAV
tara:strand:- start:1542 stop:2921 length:1380 start_codon:yes stop_codon:yes gene_type:complete